MWPAGANGLTYGCVYVFILYNPSAAEEGRAAIVSTLV